MRLPGRRSEAGLVALSERGFLVIAGRDADLLHRFFTSRLDIWTDASRWVEFRRLDHSQRVSE